MSKKQRDRGQFTVILQSEEDEALLRWMDDEVHRRKQGGEREFNRSLLALELLKRGREGYSPAR